MKFTEHSRITIHPPEQQGRGAFDGGKITEIKPVDFPNGSSAAQRIGPLFYWAWASAKGDGVIGMHPHKGFEIMSYVLAGELGHSDSLGNQSRIGAGGAQVMQAGSGMHHQEEMYGEKTEFFQIWFEPNLGTSLKKPATYNEFIDQDFPLKDENGLRIKTVLGDESLVILDAQVKMEDVLMPAGKTYQLLLPGGNALAVMTIDGEGEWFNTENDQRFTVKPRDFTIIQAAKDTPVSVKSTGQQALRLAIVEVPAAVDYPLYG